jgi:hypothetical protein
MKNKIVILLVTTLFIGGVGGYLLQNSRQLKQIDYQNISPSKNNCLADDCLLVDNLDYPVGELTPDAKRAIDEAINDEYKALVTYEAVISKFGAIRPFAMIKGAEEQHIASLKTIYDKYGIEVPENNFSGKIESPLTIQAACQTGVEAEIANADLYENTLLPAVKGYEDITTVFTNLMNASLKKHLSAFERCN